MVDEVKAAIAARQLPIEEQLLLGALRGPNGAFVHQETLYWDFKQEWPFSYSDEYFLSIARLICAFANTHGGIIVFGVHDENRTAGHNKVAPNVDRLQQSLSQLLTAVPELHLRRYGLEQESTVDILLVCPIGAAALPIRFRRDGGKYRAGLIWVRQNHEVIPAEPRHVSLLYCRSSADEENDSISGGLPPSPATIKRFVGRLTTIDRIFEWLKSSDEPRTFLYGKGGSGKTTIAYEIAKTLKQQGSRTTIYGGEALDNVVFLSAKQRAVNVIDQSTMDFVGLDFSNEKELYEAILTLSSWSSEPVADLDLNVLKNEIKSLFDLTSSFVRDRRY